MKRTLITLAMTIISTVVFSQNKYGYLEQCSSIEILNYTENEKVVKVTARQPGFQRVISHFNLPGRTKKNIDVSQWELGTSFDVMAGQYYRGELVMEGFVIPIQEFPCSYVINDPYQPY